MSLLQFFTFDGEYEAILPTGLMLKVEGIFTGVVVGVQINTNATTD
jgi:hypothetical protein